MEASATGTVLRGPKQFQSIAWGPPPNTTNGSPSTLSHCCPPPMSFRLFSGFLSLLLGIMVLGGGPGCTSAAHTNEPSPSPTAEAATADTTALDTATVDRIDAPSQIAVSDTLTVHLYGSIGPNGCYSLARIDEDRSPDHITLTPLVQPPTGQDRACTMAIVPLDEAYTLAPPFEAGPLTVTVPQTNRSAVTVTVEVTDDS